MVQRKSKGGQWERYSSASEISSVDVHHKSPANDENTGKCQSSNMNESEVQEGRANVRVLSCESTTQEENCEGDFSMTTHADCDSALDESFLLKPTSSTKTGTNLVTDFSNTSQTDTSVTRTIFPVCASSMSVFVIHLIPLVKFYVRVIRLTLYIMHQSE